MAKSFKLLNSIFCLQVWIISSSNSSHRCWLIPCVTLSWIFKIRIWSTWAVDADVSSHGNMWASMGLTHYSHYSYSRRSSNRFTFQNGSQLFLMTIRKRCENVNNLRCAGKFILCGNVTLQLCKIQWLSSVKGFDQLVNNISNGFNC